MKETLSTIDMKICDVCSKPKQKRQSFKGSKDAKPISAMRLKQENVESENLSTTLL